METSLDIVSQLVGNRLRQDDIERLLASLHTESRDIFTKTMVDILDKVSALLDISNRVANTLSLDVLLQRLIATTTEAMHAERSSLFLHDKAQRVLYARVAQGTSSQEIRFAEHQGIAGAVFSSAQAVIIADAYQDPRFNRDICEAPKARPARQQRKHQGTRGVNFSTDGYQSVSRPSSPCGPSTVLMVIVTCPIAASG